MNTDAWPLTMLLMRLGTVLWTLADATAHVLVIGSSGSGKSSAVLRTFARAFLKRDFGALILCTKRDDRPMWLNWIAGACRSDVSIFAVGHHRFDLLGYLTRHPDPAVRNRANIVEILEQMLGALLGNGNGRGDDEFFWKISRQALLTNLLAIAMHSGQPVTFDLLWAILKAVPEDLDDADHGAWRQSELGRCLRLAEARTAGTREARDLNRAKEYFLIEYPNFPEKTRSCVVMAIQGMLSQFQDPVVEDLTSGLDFTPEDVLEGRIVLVDLPANNVGRMLTLGIKQLFQKSAMRRSAGPDDAITPPAFLAIDEFQNWITPKDAEFMATAR